MTTTTIVSKAAILDAIKAFDACKHKVLEDSAEFQDANDEGKLELIEKCVRSLAEQHQNLLALKLSPRAPDTDAGIIYALDKRVFNTRDRDGNWRGAQFGIELTEYWKLVNRIDDETFDADCAEAVADGLRALRDACEKHDQKFTFAKLLASIEDELSDDAK